MAIWTKTKKGLANAGKTAVGASFIIDFSNQAWKQSDLNVANRQRTYDSLSNVMPTEFGTKRSVTKQKVSDFDKKWQKSGIFGGAVDGFFDALSGGKWSENIHKPQEYKEKVKVW